MTTTHSGPAAAAQDGAEARPEDGAGARAERGGRGERRLRTESAILAAARALFAEQGFERPSTRIPDPAFQVRLLPAHEEWMTGRLVYCEPFWSHDCVGLRDPDLARLERALDV